MHYLIITDSIDFEPVQTLKEAMVDYTYAKDTLMGNLVVAGETYVEMQQSEDGTFDDAETIRRADAVIDSDKMKQSIPRSEGYDWDYWATWAETADKHKNKK